MNSSKENVTVPRGPRSISINSSVRTKEMRVDESVLSSPGGMWLFRDIGTVSLQPNEGFVKRVPIEELPPGRYRIEITRERPGFGRGALQPVRVRVSVNGRLVFDEVHEATANNNFNFSLTLPEPVNLVEIEVPGETTCSFPVYNDAPAWASIQFWYGRYN
jgi:hypothetical protein